MSTIQRYKPLPPLEDLKPGYKAGWNGDVLIFQAEPADKIGNVHIAEETKKDEAGASIVAIIVDISPIAFIDGDWPDGMERPYRVGSIILTKRYPPGCHVVGADGKPYLMIKDIEVIGLRDELAWAQPAFPEPAPPPISSSIVIPSSEDVQRLAS